MKRFLLSICIIIIMSNVTFVRSWFDSGMLKSTYDTGNNGIVDDSEKLNGQSGSYYAVQSEVTSSTDTLQSNIDTEIANRISEDNLISDATGQIRIDFETYDSTLNTSTSTIRTDLGIVETDIANLETSTSTIVGNLTSEIASRISEDDLISNATGQIRTDFAASSGASLIGLGVIGSPTFTTVQHLQNTFHSAGWLSGGNVTDAGGATINIASGAGSIRATDSRTAEILFFDWSSASSQATTTDEINYIGIQYNAGSPNIFLTINYTDFNFQTNFPIATVIDDAGVLHIVNDQHAVGDHASFMVQRMYATSPIIRDKRAGGIILGETGTRNITLSPGTLWERLNAHTISEVNTSVSGGFDVYVGTTQIVTSSDTWDNQNYGVNNATVALSSNKYGVLWFYSELDDDLVMVYGDTQHNTAADAEIQLAPSSITNRLIAEGILIAKLIFQQNASSALAIESAFITTFETTLVSDHGNLSGLSDDDHTHYLKKSSATATYLQKSSATATYANISHVTADGSSHSFINQDVTSGSSPTFNADNFSDGGSNAIITTIQETNFESGFTHTSADGSSHADVGTNSTHTAGNGSDHADVASNTTHRSSTGADHGYINQDVTTTGTPTFSTATFSGSIAIRNIQYIFPIDNGDVNEVLKTDGNGTLDWTSTGSGDMLKSTYDTGDNGTVDDSEKLDGQVGSYYAVKNNVISSTDTLQSNIDGLSSVYLGINNKADDSNLLDGFDYTRFVDTVTVQNIGGAKTFDDKVTFSADIVTAGNLIHNKAPLGSWDIVNGDTNVGISPLVSTYTVTGITSAIATRIYVQMKYKTDGSGEGIYILEYGNSTIDIEFIMQVSNVFITHTFWIKLDSNQRFNISTQYDDEVLYMKCLDYME